MVLKHAIRFC